MAQWDAIQNLFYFIRADREHGFSRTVFKANVYFRIAGDQQGDCTRKISPRRAIDMIRMKDSPHFRSLSRLGCQGDTAAGLLRILDQEGKAESDFASRAGGVERVRDTPGGFRIHP